MGDDFLREIKRLASERLVELYASLSEAQTPSKKRWLLGVIEINKEWEEAANNQINRHALIKEQSETREKYRRIMFRGNDD